MEPYEKPLQILEDIEFNLIKGKEENADVWIDTDNVFYVHTKSDKIYLYKYSKSFKKINKHREEILNYRYYYTPDDTLTPADIFIHGKYVKQIKSKKI